MDSRGTVLAGVIIGCEVAFWLILLAGLATRYLFRLSRVSRILLVSVPVTDLVLLVASFVDLGNGSDATGIHGLAAIYLGFSVAFGPSMVRWADQRFAHRFAGGPPPVKPPKYGPAKVRHEWREWGKAVIAWAISVALMGVMIAVAGTDRTGALIGTMGSITFALVVWFLGWPLATTIWPPRPRPEPREER